MNFVWKEILAPVTRRLGTAIGGVLVGYGVAEDTAAIIVAGLVAALGVVFDLVLSHVDRKK